MQKQMTSTQSYSSKTWLSFLIPSLLGLFLFMTPIDYNDAITIPVAILAKELQALIGDQMTMIISAIIGISALISIVAVVVKPNFITRSHYLKELFLVSPFWLVIRILGAVLAIATFTQAGPAMFHDGATGGLVLNDLLPVLLCVFIFAGLLLPLLLNFGLLELMGTLLTVIMRPIFKLPGRSAIDCLASWLGDGSVGILLTSKQYQEKFYTQREAAVIGTTFSAVSITFSLVVIAQVELEAYFLPFYLTVCLAGFVCAVIIPRLPPLSWKKDVFIDGSQADGERDKRPSDSNLFQWGMKQALNRAQQAPSLSKLAAEGSRNAADMVLGVLPVIMAIGTLALVIAENTPIFDWLGQPFVPFLELLQIPQAEEASRTIVVGFADMFIPSILAASIESDMTRFVIAAMSVTQLIYMSEVGALLLGSKIPVNIFELFVIFLLRTIITLPVIALMAHLIF
ncbi:membrane protein [Marinomonas sp. SBI22]|uniref:YjiH family protein n=1 Tax=unclassified Marinomonas TaxID=196814 RepID=UPI0007AF1C4F|nr:MULTISPECIES: YjiH family protein [unclassified Marinomonas]KZM41602.1 membrane protein [Marinomonas sp. SBI22]KZM43438.1 membrane protein [Marinomonas sp. SBI8L]